MNPKLKELALRTNLDYFARDAWTGESKDLEKFAELIVKECAELVEDYVNEMSVHRADSRIKEHFGIE